MGVQFELELVGLPQDFTFTDSELIYHVRNALKSVTLGDVDSYNQLVGVMHNRSNLTPDEAALLVTSLKALSGAVSCIDSIHHWSLLSSIFGMSLWDYGPDIMDALVELIVSLAGSNGSHVDSCLEMLVRNFLPPKPGLLNTPFGITRKNQVLNRVHMAFKDIADLVPLAPRRLADIVCKRMPNKFMMEEVILIYVENMLKLESGAMGEIIGSIMILGVMDRLIEFDVDIGWDEILQDDSCKGIFEMELEDVEGSADESEKCGDETQILSSKQKGYRKNGIAMTLDSLMVLTFQHLDSCSVDYRLAKVFETLLLSFEITVLKAYKSKFAQFVIFYACSLDPNYCGVRFAETLLDWFMDGADPITRMSSVAYLASYLARAQFLPASFVVMLLTRLVGWCADYCKVCDGEVNPKAHRVFYAGCQAVMYVLCFRMRAMLCAPHLKSHLLLMPIESILKHPLSPMQVCLPSIVEEFLRQAKEARLFMVSDTFIFNNLLESELSRAFGGIERLDMFFPFDPCMLKKSDRFIRPNFVYWSMVKPTYDDYEEDDGSSSDEENAEVHVYDYDDEMGAPGMPESYGDKVDMDAFEITLQKMSITPKNHMNYMFGGALKGAACMLMPSRIRPSTSPESL